MTANAPTRPQITPQLAETGIVAILRADREALERYGADEPVIR